MTVKGTHGHYNGNIMTIVKFVITIYHSITVNDNLPTTVTLEMSQSKMIYQQYNSQRQPTYNSQSGDVTK
jgi:hypothetical protein